MSWLRYVKKLIIGSSWFLFSILLFSNPAIAEDELETKVKAAYIYHLARFVEWPDLPSDHMNICVLGSDPVGDMLLQLSQRQVKGRILDVRLNHNLDPASCHVVFISRSNRSWKHVLAALHGKNVLTVSDIENFARGGGIIGFYSDGGRIKFEINLAAADVNDLKISSKLMELARQVSMK